MWRDSLKSWALILGVGILQMAFINTEVKNSHAITLFNILTMTTTLLFLLLTTTTEPGVIPRKTKEEAELESQNATI